jgi:signal transduction histidine kinase
MEIRRKLTYQFSAFVALILLLSFIAIYISFSQSRRAEFYERLTSKGKLVAQMLIDIDEINIDVLRKIEQNNPLNLANERIVIYNYVDEELYSNDPENILGISKELIREVRFKGELRVDKDPYEISGQLYSGRDVGIVVFTGATDIFGMRKLKMLRNILLLVFIISLIFVFVAGRSFANRALNPIEKIISQVDDISISNLDSRVEEGNGKDEIAKLAITFNNMLERLESSFRMQKTFIANASHELRNPLAAITGQLEVMLMGDRSKKEYQDTIRSVLEDTIGLNSLANNLLLLAQTDPETTSHTFQKVRVDDILLQSTNEVIRRYPGFHINIKFSEAIEDEENLTVWGNDMLMKTAFINLLENSYKYSSDHSAYISVDLETNQIVIKFRDIGTGIPAEEIKQIFNPFYRAANMSNTKGHGIGLTLVENIARLHHANITVKSEVDKGSEFLIYLPLFEKK